MTKIMIIIIRQINKCTYLKINISKFNIFYSLIPKAAIGYRRLISRNFSSDRGVHY